MEQKSDMESLSPTQLISNILVDELSYAYCDNCGNGDDGCMDCHRKYQNWRLGEATAEYLANRILLTLQREGIIDG